jgi:pSer/pThr/pTyr-binding forkhead associated (FHA) protein
MAVKVTLTFTSGTLKGQKREFTQPAKCVIGRSSDCDIHFPTTVEFLCVSRHHCVLDIDPPSVQVRDLGSRNGTFLNEKNISLCLWGEESESAEEFAWYTLKEDDELRVGDTTIRVGTPPMVELERAAEAVGGGAGG